MAGSVANMRDYPKPWIRVFPFGEKENGRRLAVVICEMCCWQYEPKTRNGIAKAIKLHLRCGFKGVF